MIQPDAQGLYHPLNENDIIELVENAIQNKLQLRVRGAAQSAKHAVFTDAYHPSESTPGNNINIELDQLRSVVWGENMQVTVGAGCNLGFDPFDPSGVSKENESNNLFYQLNQKGLSIPNVPNAIHQTVGGYISTGSSGGTMQHSFDECILSVTMVDGTGKIQTFTKSNNLDDPFYGVVVSMGLLGIITQVTLQCVPAFNIIGQEVITPQADCEFDFFGPGSEGKPSLQTYITDAEFSRTLWWPIKSLQRVIAWKARTMQPADYNPSTGTPADFTPKPYVPLFPTWDLGTTMPSEIIAVTGFKLIATWPDWFYEIMGISKPELGAPEEGLMTMAEQLFPTFYPMLTNLYFPCDTPGDPVKTFWDNWLGSLPMDKVEYGDNLFDLTYSEMWVPVNMANAAVNILENYYEQNGYAATGFYTVEILGAKQSNFWLSPAYGYNVVRFNILFFRNSKTKAETYFSQFWALLKQNNINFRPHWGKKLPRPDSSTGSAYLQSQYPKWGNFMSLRKQMDPNNIFLNHYWKGHLGIG